MRRLIILLTVMGAMVALSAGAALSQATSDTFNARIPLTFVVDNPCTGEPILVDGTLHVVGHVTEDPNGGFHRKGMSNMRGEGVSRTTGTKYVVRSHVSNDNLNERSDSATNWHFTQTLQIIRQGEDSAQRGDDFLLKVLYHVTVNENGEFTAVVDQEEGECR